jgi:hypothetical protein
MENSKQEGHLAPPPLSASIDLITRSIASALALIYGLGFVILGFHDARYGVVQFSPFRARILLVGFVFASLVTLAAAAHHYGFVYLPGLQPVLNDSEPERRLHRDVVLLAAFVYTASFMAGSFSTWAHFPAQKNQPHRWQVVLSLALLTLGFLILSHAAERFREKPLRAVLLSLPAFPLVFGVLAYLEEPGASKPRVYLTAMFVLVGFLATVTKRVRSVPRYYSDWRTWPVVLAIFGIYITQIFANLPPRWGGGQPTSIVIFQNSPAPWSSSNPVDALLLDETDQGFYVLLSPSGKAFFIPRSNVSSIFFGSRDDLAKKSP